MDAEFWQQRWQQGNISFHQQQANPFLEAYFSTLNLSEGSRVLVPLCGKTLDIAWLLNQGYQVVAVELSELAVKALFAALDIDAKVQLAGAFKHYQAPGLDIFVGDIFETTAQIVADVDAIYDRAALVALPDEMRQRYAAHLINVAPDAAQILISYNYQQDLMAGPPFAVSDREVEHHYAKAYQIEMLECQTVQGGLKGQVAATEAVWRLTPIVKLSAVDRD